MNIAKHSNGSSLQRLPKRRFQFWINSYIAVLLLSALLGTYLDLIMVGLKLYSFPVRPFPQIFSINLLFSLVGLPISTLFFLALIRKQGKWEKVCFIVLFSIGMAVFERIAEELGFFAGSTAWSHIYTFGGYCFYLTAVHWFQLWVTAAR